jgi:hypothetical protein
MYFKTLRTSETGKKFQELYNEMDICIKARKEFLDKYGIESFTQSFNVGFGGFHSAFKVDQPLDLDIWKRNKDGYYTPKISTQKGKEIKKEIDSLPTISVDEINSCAGHKTDFFERIGYSFKDKNYIGFVIGNNWTYTPPKDCEEITITEYHKLFGKPS